LGVLYIDDDAFMVAVAGRAMVTIWCLVIVIVMPLYSYTSCTGVFLLDGSFLSLSLS